MRKLESITQFQQYIAFTLAEVLITLGIIGVVAALTIPVLIKNNQKTALYTMLKEDYSILNQATLTMLSNNSGAIWDNTAGMPTGGNNMRAEYAKYVKYIKLDTVGNIFQYVLTSYDLGRGTVDLQNDTNFWARAFIDSSYPAMVLSNGGFLAFKTSPNCAEDGGSWGNSGSTVMCGFITVDVNGQTAPNRLGVDVYMFEVIRNKNADGSLSDYKFVPGGLPTRTPHPDFGCGGSTGWMTLDSFGCAYYVISGNTLPKTAQSP